MSILPFKYWRSRPIEEISIVEYMCKVLRFSPAQQLPFISVMSHRFPLIVVSVVHCFVERRCWIQISLSSSVLLLPLLLLACFFVADCSTVIVTVLIESLNFQRNCLPDVGVSHEKDQIGIRPPSILNGTSLQVTHACTRARTHTHTPVSYTHLTLPTRRTV